MVEVANTSLNKDRGIKLPIYAAMGVPEYWIVDVQGGVIEVHREPSGDGYRTVSTHAPGDVLTLLELPDVRVAVADVVRGRH